MIIEGSAGISRQRSLWEKVRKNRFVLSLCGEIVESENQGPGVGVLLFYQNCHFPPTSFYYLHIYALSFLWPPALTVPSSLTLSGLRPLAFKFSNLVLPELFGRGLGRGEVGHI